MDTFRTSLEVERFFEKNFKDVVPVIPHLAQQFFESPSSPLLTVKCKPWHHRDKVLILGDAAHALVPFYGQGMNSAFEDCLLFAEIFDSFKGDPGLTIRTFSEMRQPSGYALADLSLANYKEMSSDTASSFFLWKKKIEAKLHEKFPQLWIPLYTMVAFTRIPYQQAVSISKRQDLAFYAGLAVVGFFCVLLLLLFIYLFI